MKSYRNMISILTKITSAYISYSARRFNKRIHSDTSLSVELALKRIVWLEIEEFFIGLLLKIG